VASKGPEPSPEQIQAVLDRLSASKRVDFRWLTKEEIDSFHRALNELYTSDQMSTTEIAEMLGKSQLFAWTMCRRLGIKTRSPTEGGRLYAPKRTKNPRLSFDGSCTDRAYLQGFAHGDLDVRRVSGLAVMVSSTTTHPDFTSLFKSLFYRYGPIYEYPIYDKVCGYRWKVAARLDNSFGFMLPEKRTSFPRYDGKFVFYAWLAGIVDSDGSVGMIHDRKYVRTNLQISNQDLTLLEHVKNELLYAGYIPSGPYRIRQEGYQTPSWNIKYTKDMFCMYLQRAREVKEFLRALPLRHQEKRQRKELVLSFPTPALWEKDGVRVDLLRRNTGKAVADYLRLAEHRYKEAVHKRGGESPTS
jgi:hypothetical protein